MEVFFQEIYFPNFLVLSLASKNLPGGNKLKKTKAEHNASYLYPVRQTDRTFKLQPNRKQYFFTQIFRRIFRSLLPRWKEDEVLSNVMSLSCSDCFSDLLCGEDSSSLSGDLPDCSSDLESLAYIEESIAGFIEDERNFVPGFDYVSRFRSHSLDASAREESVAWILKVRFS